MSFTPLGTVVAVYTREDGRARCLLRTRDRAEAKAFVWELIQEGRWARQQTENEGD